MARWISKSAERYQSSVAVNFIKTSSVNILNKKIVDFHYEQEIPVSSPINSSKAKCTSANSRQSKTVPSGNLDHIYRQFPCFMYMCIRTYRTFIYRKDVVHGGRDYCHRRCHRVDSLNYTPKRPGFVKFSVVRPLVFRSETDRY